MLFVWSILIRAIGLEYLDTRYLFGLSWLVDSNFIGSREKDESWNTAVGSSVMVCNWPMLTSGYRKRDCVPLLDNINDHDHNHVINVLKLETESCAKPSTVSNSNLPDVLEFSHPPPPFQYLNTSRSLDFIKGEIVISHTTTASINRVYRDEKLLGFVNQRTHHSRSSLSWRRCIYKSLLLGQPHVKSNNRNHEPNVNHWSKVSG